MLLRWPRGPQLLALWLGLMLVVAAVLAAQATRAERSHRRAARQVLANYSQLGATGLVERFQLRFGAYTCVTLAGLANGLDAGTDPAPDPRRLEATLPPRGREALAAVRAIRRVPLGPDGGTPDDLSAAARRALLRTLSDRPADAPDWGAVLRGSDRFAYRLFHGADGRPSHAWIFDLESGALRRSFDDIVAVAPVLPRFLLDTDGTPEWLDWRIESADGTMLAASSDGALSGEFTARDTAPASLDSLMVQVHIDPAAAPTLVAGGLPSSARVPAFALLGIAATLLGLALSQIRREAEVSRMREDFLASVSHELRTPLANIRLSAETVRLRRVRDDAERDRVLETAERESVRLTHLVDNVLLASRAGRGALAAHPRPVDLAALAREAAASFRPFAAASGMQVSCEPECPLPAHADPDLLRQALSNLLDNAVKYGGAAGRITITAARDGEHATLAVEDGGPGVPAADRERIFERFFRLDRDRGRAVAGSGLGLSLVRDIASLHGGTVGVEDRAGGGARFVLRLPVPPEHNA